MSWTIVDPKELEDTIFELKLRLVRKIGVKKGMVIVDVGCGQGGFTAAIAKTVGEHGKVFAVDVSDEYLAEFTGRLGKYGVKDLVTFVHADGADLGSVIPREVADMAVAYRFLEELKQPHDMNKVLKEMAWPVKRGGKVCLTELTTQAGNEAEENYIRLHKESPDSFFESAEITQALKEAGLTSVQVETFDTDIWFSPNLAKQNLEFAQVWFDAKVQKSLGLLIDKYGMKYPALLLFSGTK